MLNRYLYIYVRIILFLVIGILLCGLYRCTPEKKLSRLLKHHPELIHSDTIFEMRTFTVPAIAHDTVIQLDTSTFGLFDIIDSLAQALDTIQRGELKTEIKNYVIHRPILKDTFLIALKNGGWVKVYQIGTKLEHSLYEPPIEIKAKIPVATTTIVYKDIPWRLAWWWVLIAVVCGIAIGMRVFSKQGPG